MKSFEELSFDTSDLPDCSRQVKRNVLHFKSVIVKREPWPLTLKIYDFHTKKKINVNVARAGGYDVDGVRDVLDDADIFTENVDSSVFVIDGAFFLFDDYASGNAGHALVDYYPKLYYADKLLLHNPDLKIIYGKTFFDFEFITSKYQNFVCHESLPDVYVVNDFYLPCPYYIFGQGEIPIRKLVYFDELRNRFVSPDSSGDVEKLYISRQDVSLDTHWHRRILLNEIELIACLEQCGFVAKTFANISLAEKIKLISKAKCIVTQCGTTATYLNFLSPKTKVFGLYLPAWKYEECYIESLVKKRGGEYFHVDCDIVFANDLGNSSQPEYRPWKINGFEPIKQLLNKQIS